MENFQKLWLLLDVIHKAAAAGPAYSWISTMAEAEIVKLKAAPNVAATSNMAMEHPELKDFEHPATLVNTPLTAKQAPNG